VHTLRADRDAIVAANNLTSLGFSGATVANIDIAQRLAEALPGYLTVVVGISVLLLLLVFRSLLVPLIATAGFLLSVAAAFGASVAVYQWGWFGPVFGVETPAPLLAFLPVLAIGILFGLAMDYQVFMVSGMREAWMQGSSAKVAVRSGFSHSSRVITAAALIMTAVFSSFMLSPIAIVKPIGFILTAGVLFDAFIVRMTLIPAVMHVLGEKAWYLPNWLSRILPHPDMEGAGLTHKPEVSNAEPADRGRTPLRAA
jgi:RND superfamily putative drug exporter